MTTSEQQDILSSIAEAGAAMSVLRPLTATVVRTALTPDGYGGQTATETVVATVGARARALSGSELRQSDRVAPQATYAVTVPVGTDVTAHDAFLVDGRRFEVLFLPDNTFAAELKCLCAEVA